MTSTAEISQQTEQLSRLPLQELLLRAASIRDDVHGTRVTYSPKVFIPLTMLALRVLYSVSKGRVNGLRRTQTRCARYGGQLGGQLWGSTQ